MRDKWKRNKSRYLFQSKWYSLRQDEVLLPSGVNIEYNVIENVGYSIIVPITMDDMVVLEKIYRYPSNKIFIECPAGGIESDNPEEDAKRELLEETGYISNSIVNIGEYHVSTGTSTEKAYIFLAKNVHECGKTDREETEEIELLTVSLEEALNMVYSGDIESMSSAFALLLADKYIKDEKNG